MTIQRSACLIFNPVAGQGDSEQDLLKIQTLLEPEIDLDIRLTTPEVEAGQLAREASPFAHLDNPGAKSAATQ